MPPLEKGVEVFKTAMESILEFAEGMLDGSISNIEGPTMEGPYGDEHTIMEVRPEQYPLITILFLSETYSNRVVSCKIRHSDYQMPCLEIPPPTAMMMADDV